MSVTVRLRKRALTHEIKHGYPGFPYHSTTTTDLTQDVNRFVLRRTGAKMYHVDYYASDFAAIPPINGRNHARNSFIVCAALVAIVALGILVLVS
jgi:hypothetical protein